MVQSSTVIISSCSTRLFLNIHEVLFVLNVVKWNDWVVDLFIAPSIENQDFQITGWLVIGFHPNKLNQLNLFHFTLLHLISLATHNSFLIKYLSSIHSIGAVGVGVPLRKWKWLVLSSLFCGASVEWNQWNVSEFSCGIDEFMNQWSKWMSGNGIDERNCGRRQSK